MQFQHDDAESSVFAASYPLDGRYERPVKLFKADPDLLAGVEPAMARLLRHRGSVDSTVLTKGDWTPPAAEELGRGAIGLLVIEGLLSRTIRFAGLESAELVGAGDLLRPWDDEPDASLEFAADWRVLEHATIAILDDRFAGRICRVPGER